MDNYIIIEAQTTNGTTALPTYVEHGYFDGVSKYFEKCAAAAKSNVPRHAVTLLTERGDKVKYECFDHEVETEAEDEVG